MTAGIPLIAEAAQLEYHAGLAAVHGTNLRAHEVFNVGLSPDQVETTGPKIALGNPIPINPRMIGRQNVLAFSKYLAGTPDGTAAPTIGRMIEAAGFDVTVGGGGAFSYVQRNNLIDALLMATNATTDQCNLNVDGRAGLNILNLGLDYTLAFEAPGIPHMIFTGMAQHTGAQESDAAGAAAETEADPVEVDQMTATITDGSVPSETATSADATGITFTATAATLIADGIRTGDTITNTRTGATATCSAPSSETVVVCAGLSGGSPDDEFQIGDVCTFTRSAAANQILTSLRYQGNQIVRLPKSLAGRFGKDKPQVHGAKPTITLKVDCPDDLDEFDWVKTYLRQQRNRADFLAFNLVHNAGGATGQVLTVTFRAKLATMPVRSEGDDGSVSYGLALTQYDKSGPLTIAFT